MMAKQPNMILQEVLRAAVPLWIDRYKDKSWYELQNILQECEEILAQNGEAALFYIKGKTANSFNALAQAIAILSFCPGGIEIFGQRWEGKFQQG